MKRIQSQLLSDVIAKPVNSGSWEVMTLKGNGAESWNRYVRRRGKGWRAQLLGADLSGAELGGAVLRGANLVGANLSGADLRGAKLGGATLHRTNLRDANLCGADLRDVESYCAAFIGADLSGANLSRADLKNGFFKDANLSKANLSEGCLIDADLSGADLRGANLTFANLSNAKLYDADLRGASLTSEEQSGEHLGGKDFLALATCRGLDSVQGIDVPSYLEQALQYARLNKSRQTHLVLRAFETLAQLETGDEPSPILVRAVDTLTSQLIDYLRRHPNHLHGIPPRIFEEIVAEVLASFGWQVDLTPKSGDGGYDIFALSPNGKASVETSWIIECKRYAPDRKVGVEIVRELYGSNIFRARGAAMKILATTSHFTKGVYEMKASTYDLALKDYEGILDWLNTYRPNPNGKLYLKDERLVVPDA